MRFTLNFLLSLFIIFNFSNTLLAQEVRVARIDGGKTHGCLFRSPSNLLISLAKRKVGSVLDFERQLTLIAKKIKKNKSSIAALKGKTDTTSKNKRKKLKKNQADLKLLAKGISACRDGITGQSLPVDCASPAIAEGTLCDDLNPCTDNDKCASSKCLGTTVSDDTKLKCSFDKCSLEIQQCVNSQFIACIIGAAGNEICNGVDDDCNGQIDENNICIAADVIPTATASPSGSFIPTISASPAATVIAGATNTAVVTPVVIATTIPSFTATATRTSTRTFTPTSTNTRTFTPTSTNTRTFTPTSTRTFTPTRTPTRTATPTPTTPPCQAASNNNSANPTGCACTSNLSCCSGICRVSDDTCAPPTSIYNTQAAVTCPNFRCDADARPGVSARPLDAPCGSNLDCCSGICRSLPGQGKTCGPKTSIPNINAAPCCE